MLEMLLNLSLLLISISTIGFVYRIVKGPTTGDRAMALDAIGINIIAVTAILSIMLRTTSFVEVILLIGIIAFVGTVAFGKFLEKGAITEYDRDQ
ncbi:Na(+)/H(+) antiporter subunit F1 [Priestia flexa]|uniref:Na(+)/H(+) antiporter subunit F1 n=1 Tax=Priestia flexa TaxID=86664 RepID=UPI00288D8703|nr:Na(+)/H(+) antiporter subunit F1 [Priestia flexa]MDT2045067.1 Na(+)/H(+) antiporter subunit F1 [Priestia flexa]